MYLSLCSQSSYHFRIAASATNHSEQIILPRASEPDPVLRISDLVPGYASNYHRAVPLPLKPYRKALGKAVGDLALARKVAVHTKRKRGGTQKGLGF